MEIKHHIKFNDFTIEYDDLNNDAQYISNNGVPTKYYCYKLNSGKLFIDIKAFDGYMFLDNYNNFYDTINKRIYFNLDESIFIGDEHKEAFSLFDNFDKMEKKLKDKVNEIKVKEMDENEITKIKNEFTKELIEELENFDLNKIILKNGKYYLDEDEYYYIHDDIAELYLDNKKYIETEFFQETKNNIIKINEYGNYKNFEDNYEGEIYYNTRVGKGKMKGDKNEKFYFLPSGYNFNGKLKEIKKEEENKKSTLYYVTNRERITLEK